MCGSLHVRNSEMVVSDVYEFLKITIVSTDREDNNTGSVFEKERFQSLEKIEGH